MRNRNYFYRLNKIHDFIFFNLNLSLVTLLMIICLLGLANVSMDAQPLAADKSKFVGNVISNGYSIRSNFSKYWNQVTAENAGKWGNVESSAGSYNWTQLDNIYNYALTNGFPYKHHCLVWGNQQPGFLASLDSAAQYQEVENWIKETGTRYPNADMVDVVNEPLHATPPVYKNALGGDGATGWDWVIKTFELARKYWSTNAKLLINEYNILNSSTNANNYVKIINLLKDRGLIDGIGIQCHSGEVVSQSTASLKSNLDIVAATGLPIYISEFDINDPNDNTQLQKYQSIFPLLYEHAGVAGITLWGYIYNEIWQVDAYLLNDRNAERPAMQWLRTYLQSPFAPVLVSPLSTTEESLTPTLIWRSSQSAINYQVQISELRTFSMNAVDTTVSDTLLIAKNLKENSVYYWRVRASNDKGSSLYSESGYFVTKKITGVNENDELPRDYSLSQNYPNPFNPTTIITFNMPEQNYVRLDLLDVLGREVMNIASRNFEPGIHKIQLNAFNLSSGVYFYRLRAGNFISIKKLMLTR